MTGIDKIGGIYVASVSDGGAASDMKKKELAEKAGISIATITKMGKDGAVVSSDVLVKICTALECTMDDIVEIVPEKNS
mgnify:CR=1 FL=1